MTTKRKRFSPATRHEVWQRFGKHCAYCGQPITLKEMQIDHVNPIDRGGTNDIDNLYPACRMCNFYKGTYKLEEYRRYLAGVTGRLERDFLYRVAKRYDFIRPTLRPITFYFETRKEEV